MIGNSVVPGLPNRWVMPSSLSSARKAERPVMRFFMIPPRPRTLLPGRSIMLISRARSMEVAHGWAADSVLVSRMPRSTQIVGGLVVFASHLERILPRSAALLFRALPHHAGKALQRHQRFA